MQFVIVSGLSGAGKSKAASFLEDIGFYCVDNMPMALLPQCCLTERPDRAASFLLEGQVVILMDGAAIFDPTTDRYLDKAEISYEDCCEIKKALNDMDISVFTSIVWANAMLIFCSSVIVSPL